MQICIVAIYNNEPFRNKNSVPQSMYSYNLFLIYLSPKKVCRNTQINNIYRETSIKYNDVLYTEICRLQFRGLSIKVKKNSKFMLIQLNGKSLQ